MATWTHDARIEETRKLKGWREFNRDLGKLNFYIDTIVKQGRGYLATSFRLRDRLAPPYEMFPMDSGSGKTPLDACLDAYRKAVAAGHMEDTHLEALFASQVDDLDDMIGAALEGVGAAFGISYAEQAADYASCLPADEDEDLIG